MTLMAGLNYIKNSVGYSVFGTTNLLHITCLDQFDPDVAALSSSLHD